MLNGLSQASAGLHQHIPTFAGKPIEYSPGVGLSGSRVSGVGLVETLSEAGLQVEIGVAMGELRT